MNGSNETDNSPVSYRSYLEQLYARYNHRKYVHPDPLEFLYSYSFPQDVELVGIIASSLAYGRVTGILRSVSLVLKPLGRHPMDRLVSLSYDDLQDMFYGFRHRFTSAEDMCLLLWGIRKLFILYGSVETCFLKYISPGDRNLLPAMSKFVDEVERACGSSLKFLLPSPEKGSACKRFNLFLRWMVRQDNVDLGAWDSIPASMLIIPLDTHMYQIGKEFLFTCRKQANLKTAIEITDAFREICPEDPVRYDFALTRLGIRSDD